MLKVLWSFAKMLGLTLVVLLLAVLGWAGLIYTNLDAPEAEPDRTVTPTTYRLTNSGPINGFTASENMHAWTGIPYAKPVSGMQRWTMPTPPETWNQPRDMVNKAPFCPQFSFDAGSVPEKGFIGEEDCLTLDIYAPAFTQDELKENKVRLPVMFWIHGGGNTMGAAGDLSQNKLVTDGNVVLVTVQYRLGPLGFFSHPAIRDDGVKTANFGLEDQILALKWVQDNIAAFGGDPENVTLFGESAGGVNIFSLILSERAKGLFHKTIIQSGSSTSTPRWKAEAQRTDETLSHINNSSDIVERWLVEAGYAESTQDAKLTIGEMTSPELLEVMRQIPTLPLLKTYQRNPGDAMYPIPAAIRDGFTIPDEEPEQLFMEKGQFNATPGIFGSNRDELGWAYLFSEDLTPRNTLGIPTVENFEPRDAALKYTSDIWKFIGADRPASWLTKTGEGQIFVYRFDWDEEPSYLGRDLGRYVGAAHAFDIPFVFGQFRDTPLPNFFLTKANAPGRQALSSAMRRYWAQFAHTGSPGTGTDGSLPDWKNWTPERQKETMLLDTPEGGGPRMAGARVNVQNIKDTFDADPALNTVGKCAVALFLEAAAEWTPEKLRAYKNGACIID